MFSLSITHLETVFILNYIPVFFAIKIAAEAKPLFASKEDYFKKIDSLVQGGDRIKYEDGRIILRG